MQQNWTLSVSQLNEYVRVQLASDPILRNLSVEGEISGLKRVASGHIYFSLKDESARVQCVMFRQNAANLDFVPKDGMKVTLRGSASLFVRDGSYQVYVDSMERQGVGDLYRRFMILKEKLAREGLFDPAIKKPIPEIPECVGIVTSLTGAVLHDILRVGWRRWPNMRFVLAPCSVQGSQAALEIAEAIETLNRYAKCDVILCGRGGGSLEDLWPFNEEVVARAIHASAIPVISCVGHETDFTIADFVADARAATPSNAAEISIPNRREYLDELHILETGMRKGLMTKIERCRTELDHLRSSAALKAPSSAWTQPRQAEISEMRRRMRSAFERKLYIAKAEIAQVRARFDAAHSSRMQSARAELAMLETRLTALRPGAPLERGYALVERDGQSVERMSNLQIGDRISVWMQDGGFLADVTGKTEGSMWERGKEEGADI